MNHSIKKRNSYFDNAKSVLIFLVVIGHFVSEELETSDVFKSMYIWIYSFHMPLFIFLGGFFSKNLINNKERVIKKSFEFFTLFILMKISMYIAEFFFKEGGTAFSLLSDGSVPWYLLSMSIMYLLSYALRNVNRRAVLILFFMIALFIGYDSDIRDFLVLSRTLVFYPFFILGLMCTEETVAKLKSRKFNYLIASVVVIVSLVICYLFPDELFELKALLTARNPYKSLNDELEPYGILLRISLYAIGFFIGSSIMTLMPKKNLGYLTKIGTKTLPVYFFHRQILWVFSGLGAYNLFQNIFGSFTGNCVWLLSAAAVTVITSSAIFEKPLKYWSGLLYKK